VCGVIFRSFVFQVVQECKETAAKRRRQSTRLENLGIPEEELLRQQQELFAKAREAAVMQEQQQQLLLQQLTAGAAAGGAERPTGSTIGFYGSAEH
jgi:cytochrome c553